MADRASPSVSIAPGVPLTSKERDMRGKIALATTGVAVALMTAGLAQAQQSSSSKSSSNSSMASTTATLHETKSDDATAKALNIRAKDLRSMEIYGSDGKKIASVDNVLADQSNDIKAVTADVGGFLGVGSHEVVFPVDKLQKGSDKDRLQTAMTKDQIQNLDRWSQSSSGSTAERSGTTAPATTTQRPATSGAAPSNH
jgi:hypothetical protein